MWGWILMAIAILAGFFLLPGLLARLPHGKGGGGLGPALEEMNAAFDPSRRNLEVARRQVPPERADDEPKDPEAGG